MFSGVEKGYIGNEWVNSMCVYSRRSRHPKTDKETDSLNYNALHHCLRCLKNFLESLFSKLPCMANCIRK